MIGEESPRTADGESTAGTALRRGRPRSKAADTAILKAALALLDTHGYSHMTVADIAARAGVAKQTIYRRWTSKAEVVLAALTTRTAVEVSAPDTGSVHGDLRALLRNSFAVLRSGRERTIRAFMAEAQFSDSFAEAFREQFVAHRRKVLTDLLRRGIGRAELRPDTDLEFLADMIYGPMWYRLLNRHAPLDDAFADALTSFVLHPATTRED